MLVLRLPLLVLPLRTPPPEMLVLPLRTPPPEMLLQPPPPTLQPGEVVEAMLGALQASDLGTAHGLMSPAYHTRTDAFERFSSWFASPVYEALLRCQIWELRGLVSMREATREIPLPDGGTFHGSASVETMVRVDVTAGRAKWEDSGARGSRVGQPLPTTTYLFTLSLQSEGPQGDCWTIDQIAPEAPVVAPINMTPAVPAAAFDSEAQASPAFLESFAAFVALALILTAGQWLGEQTGVFGASLDPAYWGDSPSRTTLYNLLD